MLKSARFVAHSLLVLALMFTATALCFAAHQVAISWGYTGGTGDPAVGFDVLRSGTTGGPYTSIGKTTSVSTLTFTDTTVICGQTYFYVVAAYNVSLGVSQDGPNSNEGKAVIPCSPPTNPPTGLTVAPSLKVSLKWQDPGTGSPTNLTGALTLKASMLWQDTTAGRTYNVYRADGVCKPGQAAIRVGSNISILGFDNYVGLVTTYCYWVTALSSGTETGPSNTVLVGFGAVSGS